MAAFLSILVLAACGAGSAETEAGSPRPAGIAGGPASGPAAAAVSAAPLAPSQSARARNPGLAVLVEGSTPVKGLPGFGRNALPGLAGVYEIAVASAAPSGSDRAPAPTAEAGQTAIRVRVWYTRERLLLPSGLADPGCRVKPQGYAVAAAPPGADGSELWFMSTKDYTLIASIPDALVRPCDFAAGLMDRFAFFSGYASRLEDASFPASIDLGS